MTAPAEKPHPGGSKSGGLAQLVRWLNDERPITGSDDGFVPGAPRRIARWTYGAPPSPAPAPEIDRDVLGEVRIGPAPRCAVAGETIALSVSLISDRGGMYLGWPITLDWSTSDPAVATVDGYGIVEVHSRGRVELTCTCEGKSGSVLLTVVEPSVAAAVGLPVPARLLAPPAAPASAHIPAADAQEAAAAAAASALAAPATATPTRPTRGAATPAATETGSAEPPPTLARPVEVREGPVAHTDLAPTQALDTPPLVPPAARTPAAATPAVASTASPTTDAPATVAPAPAAQRPARARVRARGAGVASVAPTGVASVPFSELPPVHRRSIERGAVKHGVVASLTPSRGTRRVLFRLVVGAATGAFVAVALSQSPEEFLVVGGEPAVTTGGEVARRAPTSPRRQSALAGGPRAGAVAAAVTRTRPGSAPLGDTSSGTTLRADDGRIVAVAAGAAALTPSAAPERAPAAAPPSVARAAGTNPPPVNRVVLAPSPSQLIEGESVRLAAAGLDERGDALAGRAVTWKSENSDVAVVDEHGVVTARRAGTVTIVATSEGRSGRVTLTVGARQPESRSLAEAPAPAVPPARENGPVAAMQVMRARVDEFVQALRERNSGRVATLYQAESPQDRKNLQALLERLRRPEARFKASDAQLAAPEIREMEAGVEFQVPMSWTTPFGRVRSQTATFRAVLEPGDGGWRLVAIRAVGKIE